MEKVDPSRIILLSGGIDSAAALHFYKKVSNDLVCLHFSYGQKSEKSELNSAKKISEYYDSSFENIRLKFPLTYNKEEILCRNILFIMSAAAIQLDPCEIILGIHSGTGFYDCSKDFLDHTQKILDGYFYGVKRVVTPFGSSTKESIIEYCIKESVPLHLTHSCIEANIPCGKCMSCRQRSVLDEN